MKLHVVVAHLLVATGCSWLAILPAGADTATRPVADKWALVIGISEFADPSLNLKYPAKDARDFYGYLIKDGRFAPDHVKLLTNDAATRGNILAAVGDRWLPKVAGPDDLVVIYISSHGSPSDANVGGVNYILAHDTTKDNIYATGVAMQDLSELLKNRLHAQRLVLVLDACHSGNAGENKGVVRTGNVNAEELSLGSGRTVISSSEPSQMSWESKDYPNGVFTHYLIEGLRQKGADTKLGDAYAYMREKVQEEVLRDRGAMQTPVMKGTTDGAQLALAAAPARAAAAPPDLAGGVAGKDSVESGAEPAAVAMAAPAAAAPQIRVWETYLESGTKARSEGRFAEAEKMLKESLVEAEKFGADSPQNAASINELGDLYRLRGQYAEAEPLCRKALSIREKSLGADDPAVAQSLNSLALLLEARGKFSEAEPLFRQSLAIWKKKPGEESPEAAQGLNNLARDLFDRGKYSESMDTCKRALEIREKLLGPDSPQTAQSLVTLGQLYYKTGKYADAKKALTRSLDIRERVLGAEHPDLIESINCLAELYTVQRRYSEAEPLFYRSLAISEKAFGPEHPAVADSLNQLALLYELRLKYPQAETNCKRAMEIREKALGPDHPAVAESLTNLAWLSYAQEQYPQADSLYRRAQAISEKALESDNPRVATTLEYYAYLLRATSRRKQATELTNKIKAMRVKHALENPNTKVKTDSAILSARAGALSTKQNLDRKKR